MKKEEEFFPIPSLDSNYEISRRGVVRNAKTKYPIAHTVHLCFRGKKGVSRSVDSLLWEVFGIRNFKTLPIPVSLKKDAEKKYFPSQIQAAKFLAKATNYSVPHALRQLKKKKRSFAAGR